MLKLKMKARNSLRLSDDNWKIQPAFFFITVIIVAGLLLLWPQAGSLASALDVIGSAELKFIAIAALILFVTFIPAAFILQILALKKIDFSRTLLIQFAGGFATKIVPAGLGGLALNSRYLVKNKHTLSQAGVVAIIANSIGFLAHSSLLIISFLLSSQPIQGTSGLAAYKHILWVVAVLLVVLSILYITWPRLRKQFTELKKALHGAFHHYRARPNNLLAAYVSAALITACYGLILNIVAKSVGTELSLTATALALTANVASASLSPTPGGIGGAEAGLSAALTALGVGLSQAISVALIFRFITYWLPILPGLLFFNIAIRKRYI